MRACAALREGMTVSLEAVDLGEARRLHADVLRLGASFEDGCGWKSDAEFVLYPGSSFTMLRYYEQLAKRRHGAFATEDERRLARRRVADELEENRQRQRRVDAGRGAPLRFGDRVQLKHGSSGSWLCEGGVCATTSAECLRLGFCLDAVGEPGCVFRVAPAFRSQREGGPVREQDEIILLSAGGFALGACAIDLPGGDAFVEAVLRPTAARKKRDRVRVALAPVDAGTAAGLPDGMALALFHEERQRFLSADTREIGRRKRLDFLKAAPPDEPDVPVVLRRGGADKDVDANGREIWILEVARGAAPADAGSVPARLRHASSMRYLGPKGDVARRGARGEVPASLVLERGDATVFDVQVQSRGDASGSAGDLTVTLRHRASGLVLGDAGDDDADDGDRGLRALLGGDARAQRTTFQVGAVTSRRVDVAHKIQVLRDEARAYSARVRADSNDDVTRERAEHAMAAAIAFLLGRDDGSAPGPDAAPDAGRQDMAREIGLIGALVDVVRGPTDREARSRPDAELAAYLDGGKLRFDDEMGTIRAIGPGLRAHKLAMKALGLCLQGSPANEFFFVEGGDGRWTQALISQTEHRLGASEALSRLLSDNETLLEDHVGAGLVDDFARLIEVRGPRADLLGFFGAICSCRGKGVKSNQELTAQRLGVVALGGVGSRAERRNVRRRRRRLLLRCAAGGSRGLPAGPPAETVLSPPFHREPRGAYLAAGDFAPTYATWSFSSDPWTRGSERLFWAPRDVGVRKASPDDGFFGDLAAGLDVDVDDRGGAWVALPRLLWVLEPDALARRVLGVDADHVKHLAEQDRSLAVALDRQVQLAEYFVQQIRTYAELCRSRSYNAIMVLEREYTYDACLGCLSNPALPVAARAAFATLLHALYLDRFPHERHVGKARLPEMVYVLDDARARLAEKAADDASPTLLHFSLERESRRSLWARSGYEGAFGCGGDDDSDGGGVVYCDGGRGFDDDGDAAADRARGSDDRTADRARGFFDGALADAPTGPPPPPPESPEISLFHPERSKRPPEPPPSSGAAFAGDDENAEAGVAGTPDPAPSPAERLTLKLIRASLVGSPYHGAEDDAPAGVVDVEAAPAKDLVGGDDAASSDGGWSDDSDGDGDDADAQPRIRAFVEFDSCDKFFLLEVAVERAFGDANRGDGDVRGADAYTMEMMELLQSLVSFGFFAEMASISALLAPLVAILDGLRGRDDEHKYLLHGNAMVHASTMKVLQVLDQCVDVFENWRLGSLLDLCFEFFGAHFDGKHVLDMARLPDHLGELGDDEFLAFSRRFDAIFESGRLDATGDVDLHDVLGDLMMYPSDDVMAYAFRLRQRLNTQRDALLDYARATLVLPESRLRTPEGCSFATYEELDVRVSDLRHYVDSHEVWGIACGGRPAGSGALADARSLLAEMDAFAAAGPQNRKVLFSLGLTDILVELMTDFDVNLGTADEAAALRTLVELAYECLATMLGDGDDDVAKEVLNVADADVFDAVTRETVALARVAAGRARNGDAAVAALRCFAGDAAARDRSTSRHFLVLGSLLAARARGGDDVGGPVLEAAAYHLFGDGDASPECRRRAVDALLAILDDDQGDGARSTRDAWLAVAGDRYAAPLRRVLGDPEAPLHVDVVRVLTAAAAADTVDRVTGLLPLELLEAHARHATTLRECRGDAPVGDATLEALCLAYATHCVVCLRCSPELVPARDYAAYRSIGRTVRKVEAADATLEVVASKLRADLLGNHRVLRGRDARHARDDDYGGDGGRPRTLGAS